MSDDGKTNPNNHAAWIIGWFILDAVVALAPPIYWAFDRNRTAILGLPAVVTYFVAVAVFITASIVAAYLAEARSGKAG
ncbi:hypothetical protein [Hyphomicrobium sp.]|uniref:hypothetical protein n=1 Tax=Hyphomicrobium sp. TaxID=82 RepID=UPI001D48CE5E|nr:hypothetical protein [Hyphomicrobium sp.]MBY0560304.1 hypothetical protein [Hyphomicrobium sp.]